MLVERNTDFKPVVIPNVGDVLYSKSREPDSLYEDEFTSLSGSKWMNETEVLRSTPYFNFEGNFSGKVLLVYSFSETMPSFGASAEKVEYVEHRVLLNVEGHGNFWFNLANFSKRRPKKFKNNDELNIVGPIQSGWCDLRPMFLDNSSSIKQLAKFFNPVDAMNQIMGIRAFYLKELLTLAACLPADLEDEVWKKFENSVNTIKAADAAIAALKGAGAHLSVVKE